MTIFRVLEPEEWGMRWAKPPIAERLLDPEQFIHHRAGNGRHYIPAEQAFYEMNEGAINDANDPKSATDYDILVHEHFPTDTVTIGIARGPWLSAATRDRNELGEAICAMGYFHPGHSLSEKPSPGMIEGIARACVISRERGWTAPDAVILGHRDNPAHPKASVCPGDYLYAEMPTIRERVAELSNPQPEELTVRYFYTQNGGPTLWGTSDGLTAVRLEAHHVKARGDIPQPVPVLTAAEAAKFVYVNGLTSESVR